MKSLEKTGERRHETCRYGELVPADRISIGDFGPGDAKVIMPLCSWRLPENAPPAVSRHWGGYIEYARDCAICKAHAPVPIKDWRA